MARLISKHQLCLEYTGRFAVGVRCLADKCQMHTLVFLNQRIVLMLSIWRRVEFPLFTIISRCSTGGDDAVDLQSIKVSRNKPVRRHHTRR
jgi:hypothetical protein